MREEAVPLTTELPGRTQAFMVSEVRPQVNGIIRARLFQEGTDVRAGQVLYKIDPATYQAAYAQAQAQLANAQANVTSAKLRSDRYGDLIKINAVSRQDYDDAQAAYKQAAATVQQNQAAVQSAAISLGYTNVKAPISGRIGRSTYTQGALVTASQADALATIQTLSPIYVDVVQSSSDLLALRRALAGGTVDRAPAMSAKVRLTLQDGSTYPIEGDLKFSDVTVDQATGSVTLRAVFPNPQGLLLPGMYVRAVITQGVDSAGILVPQQGISRDQKGQAIAMVVGPDNKAQPRTVTTSQAIGDKWLVTSGLKAGDRVIVEGLMTVQPGMAVKPVPAGSASAAPSASQGAAH